MMANMPAFDDACARSREHGLAGRIGQHLVLSEGPALTEAIRRWPRLCRPDGTLATVPGSITWLDSGEARALETEWVAQIHALRGRGVSPTHFDSHAHVHTQWPLATIVMRLAKRFGVPAIRLSRNCGHGIPLAKRIYKRAFNARLAAAGLGRTRWFGSSADVETLPKSARGDVEIMVHPGLDASGAVVDLGPDPRPLAEVAERWSATHRPCSYAELTGVAPPPARDPMVRS